MKALVCWISVFLICAAVGGEPAARATTRAGDDTMQAVIDEVEKECLKGPDYIYTIGRVKAKRLAELVRLAKPRLVVECGTALGYSGLWMARELKAAGQGKLITIEIDPKLAKRAEDNFRRAGLADLVTVRRGDARKVVSEIEGPIDFVFIDCNPPNYLPCLEGVEKRLSAGAVVVADNVAVSESQLRDYLERVRSKFESRTEWFDANLPWRQRDAMEVSIVPKDDAPKDQIQNVIDELEKECLKGPRRVPIVGREKAKRLAELVRIARPSLVVECGTAWGYSGLWIARELKAAGKGRLITIEIDPKAAKQAEAYFAKAGVADVIALRVGDARKVVREIEGPIDFVFLDCNGPNYLPCLEGLEKQLAPGATIVADNVGVSERELADYFKHVRSKYESRTEWFDTKSLPWVIRDAIEVSIMPK